jgi:hydrogenase nickel incorporation protein HypA/HybF
VIAVHEYSLVMAVVERVEQEARRRGALAVHGVRVSVGELAGVDPELFRTAYDTFRAGTACEAAALELVVKPAAWGCSACGKAIAKGEVLRCAACGAPARLADGSDALLLDAIDLEVP